MSVTAQAWQLPPGSESYLCLQRTELQHPINREFRRFGLGTLYDRFLLPPIERRRRDELAAGYFESIKSDFDSIAPALSQNANAILDIGCGLAGVDLLLWDHYGGNTTLHLLDKDGRGQIYYGYKAQGAHYNSLDLARSFLVTNGVDEGHVRTFDVNRDGFPEEQRFDLILSLLSWGYHYPVETYALAVSKALAPGGTVILDVRQDKADIAPLQQLIGGQTKVLEQTKKYRRTAITS